ncbi:hypothetical protein FACS189488_14320 [Betaproteobacteria bacterium]|nr:hypothetical protein FACS189488_14320 [Betaproteobacteria bacterium]
MNRKSIAKTLGGLAVLTLLAGNASAQNRINVPNLMAERCSICHADELGRLPRIQAQRKTPEGWLMTVVRMQRSHELRLTDDERRALVKHLADTQGLAPAETAPARYVLERRLNTVESFPSQQFTEMCARCHSGARVVLQRRTATEWERLVHFHLGQFPTLEYQALGRDRDWFNIALKEIAPALAKDFAYGDDAWQKWKLVKPAPVEGQWVVSGHLPGKGDFNATLTATLKDAQDANAKDQYTLTLAGSYADGEKLSGQGSAVIYTGYEWRGKVTINGVAYRQVFAIEGDTLRGRQFVAEHDEIGADIVAARQGSGTSHVLAVQPAWLKTGAKTRLTIVGNDLAGEPELPAGIKVLKVLERTPGRIVVNAIADRQALGTHKVKVAVVVDGVARVAVAGIALVIAAAGTQIADAAGGAARAFALEPDAQEFAEGVALDAVLDVAEGGQVGAGEAVAKVELALVVDGQHLQARATGQQLFVPFVQIGDELVQVGETDVASGEGFAYVVFAQRFEAVEDRSQFGR